MSIIDWSSDVCSSDLRISGHDDSLAGRHGCRKEQKKNKNGAPNRCIDQARMADRFRERWEPERPGAKSLRLLPSGPDRIGDDSVRPTPRSEEPTSELQSLVRISYAVFCLKKKTHTPKNSEPT